MDLTRLPPPQTRHPCGEQALALGLQEQLWEVLRGRVGWEEEEDSGGGWHNGQCWPHFPYPRPPIPALQNPLGKLLPGGPGLHLGRVAFLCRDEEVGAKSEGQQGPPRWGAATVPLGVPKQDRREIRVTVGKKGRGSRKGEEAGWLHCGPGEA